MGQVNSSEAPGTPNYRKDRPEDQRSHEVQARDPFFDKPEVDLRPVDFPPKGNP